MPKRKRYEQDTQAHPGCLSKGSLFRKCVQNPSTSLSATNGLDSVSQPLNVLQKIAAWKSPAD